MTDERLNKISITAKPTVMSVKMFCVKCMTHRHMQIVGKFIMCDLGHKQKYTQ